MNKNKKLLKSLLRLLPGLLILLAIIVVSYLILRHFGLTNLSREEIQNLINKGGIYSYLIFVLISFLQGFCVSTRVYRNDLQLVYT
jgi:uncharacterized membrane protein YdjX (TVP38/TMEM64 family)